MWTGGWKQSGPEGNIRELNCKLRVLQWPSVKHQAFPRIGMKEQNEGWGFGSGWRIKIKDKDFNQNEGGLQILCYGCDRSMARFPIPIFNLRLYDHAKHFIRILIFLFALKLFTNCGGFCSKYKYKYKLFWCWICLETIYKLWWVPLHTPTFSYILR